MNILRWRIHLHPVLAAGLILGMAIWLVVIYRRCRCGYSLRETLMLIAPKALIVLLMIVAYFDPVWTVVRNPGKDRKVTVLLDTSTSMDVDDASEDSRVERAESLVETLRSELGGVTGIEILEFDESLRDPQKDKRPAPIRGTNLGKSLYSLSDEDDTIRRLGVVVLTDGGDESLQGLELPDCPVHIAGIGAEPDTWDDLAIASVEAPAVVEPESDFEVTAQVVLRSASGDLKRSIPTNQVKLQQRIEDRWQDLASKTVDLERLQSTVTFEATARSEGGPAFYRVSTPAAPGEMSELNNVRTFSVETREDTLHVLFFAQELGWDFRQIKKELERDPVVEVTSLLRISDERFLVQGSRQEGDQMLDAGFPTSRELLDLYKCVIIGSFDASQWRADQFKALIEYVEQGGSVVLLGGEHSFGRGGYARTPIEPLFPWRISATDPPLQIGSFSVRVPIASAAHGIVARTADLLAQAGSAGVESVNMHGKIKSGAVSLLDTSAAGGQMSLVALQRYGEGQTMGVATNTMWKWTRTSELMKEAYGHFWRSAIRHLVGSEEGTRFLAVKWDQSSYSPGERAVATIRTLGRQDGAQLHLKTSLKIMPEGNPVRVESSMSRENVYTAEMVFSETAGYLFEADAYRGEELIESYEKTFVVGTGPNEGANLEIDHAFLDNLARQTGGIYVREGDFDTLIDRIKAGILSEAATMEIPLVQDRYLYLIVFLLILMAEWFLRRRMNLF